MSRNRSAGEKRISAKGIEYKVCAYGMRIQTLLFPNEFYTPAKALAWAKSHGFRVQKVDVTTNYIRIQQQPTALFVKGSFRTFQISESKHIKSVIGCPRFAILKGRAKPQKSSVRKAA